MTVTLDRFEGNFALVELPDKKIVQIPKQLIPEGSVEGTVIRIEIDRDEAANREKRIEHLRNTLWAD